MADEILEFLIDEDNEAKFTEHGLTSRQIVQVLDSSHLIVKNRRRRRASHMLSAETMYSHSNRDNA